MNTPIDLDNDEFLTIAEAAHKLRAGPASVYRWLASGRLPGFRRGGRLMVRKADLEAFLTPVRAAPPPAFGQAQRVKAQHAKHTERVLREAGILP